jgi:hypothetical protein
MDVPDCRERVKKVGISDAVANTIYFCAASLLLLTISFIGDKRVSVCVVDNNIASFRDVKAHFEILKQHIHSVNISPVTSFINISLFHIITHSKSLYLIWRH